jgi:hypothetical protein
VSASAGGRQYGMKGGRKSRKPGFPAVARYDGQNVHAEMCKLSRWFVQHVAFSYDFAIDHHGAMRSQPLEKTLSELTQLEYGATCGGLALFMASTAKGRGYDAMAMNFGNGNGPQSHVLVLVRLGSGERIFYDPTLGCYSGRADGAPVSIQETIKLLRQDRTHGLRWIDIGARERPVMFCAELPPPFPLASPVRRLKQARCVAMTDLDFMTWLTWGNIWQWAQARNASMRTLFDCLRFTISTSGEKEAEELAEQLRAIKR